MLQGSTVLGFGVSGVLVRGAWRIELMKEVLRV